MNLLARKYSVPLVVAGVLLVGGTGFIVWKHYHPKQSGSEVVSTTSTPTLAPTPLSTPTPTASLVSPSPTAPIESPSPSPSGTVSAATKKILDDFYTAYKVQDSKKLLVDLMTPPANDDEKVVQSLLWQGKDLKGISGGPTLFVSSVASAVVQSYSVEHAEKVGVITRVTVKEQILLDSQKSQRERIVEVVGDTEPAISNYLTVVGEGKYSGFFN